MGLLRVTMRGYIGTNANFQVYVVETPNPEYQDAPAVVEYLANIYFDHLRWALSTSYTLVDAYVQPLIPGGLPGVVVAVAPLPFAGLGAGQLLPQQIAAMVSFSALAPRPNSARKYFGGFTETLWEGSNWDSTLVAALGNVATELVDMPTLLGAGYSYRAMRFGAGGTWTLGAPLTEWRAEPYARTQRRRRPGVGI